MTATTTIARVDTLLARPFDARPLRLMRGLFGPIVLLHLRPFLIDARDGRIYRDSFIQPFSPWYPHAPRALYLALLYACAAAAVLMIAGPLTRAATTYCAAFVTYNLFLSKTIFLNNRAFLMIILCGLTFVPRKGPTMPYWPVLLMRIEVTVVYLASGGTKLFDSDWWSGLVPWARVDEVAGRVRASVLPDWFVRLLLDRDFHTVAGKVIILTEIAIVVTLWIRRLRILGLGLAIAFHTAIQLSAAVQVFSFAAIAALLIWWPPPAVPWITDRAARWRRAVLPQTWVHR